MTGSDGSRLGLNAPYGRLYRGGYVRHAAHALDKMTQVKEAWCIDGCEASLCPPNGFLFRRLQAFWDIENCPPFDVGTPDVSQGRADLRLSQKMCLRCRALPVGHACRGKALLQGSRLCLRERSSTT